MYRTAYHIPCINTYLIYQCILLIHFIITTPSLPLSLSSSSSSSSSPPLSLPLSLPLGYIAPDEMKRRLTEAQKQFDEDLQTRLTAKDEECQKTLIEKMNEHVVAVEAEKARALKLEASKWKQALKEAEKRVALEVAQGRLDGRYEREQELRFELVDLAERNQQALLVVEEKHKKAIFDAQAVTQQQLSELKEAMLVEQQRAVVEAEKALRARNGKKHSNSNTLSLHLYKTSVTYLLTNTIYMQTRPSTTPSFDLLTYPPTRSCRTRMGNHVERKDPCRRIPSTIRKSRTLQ